MTGFAQNDSGVEVQLSDGKSLQAEYLVGCDGGRSVIRKTAGIEFRGWDPSISFLLAGIGVVSSPTGVLVRPDGYVAWVGAGAEAGLTDALVTWFGPPAAT